MYYHQHEGKHYDSLKPHEKDQINALDYHAPKGESWADVRARASSFFREKHSPAPILAFTHGGLICTLTYPLGLTDIITCGSVVALKIDKQTGLAKELLYHWEFPLEAVV